jgi:hypothetical protein
LHRFKNEFILILNMFKYVSWGLDMYIVVSYAVYLAVSLLVTIWVASTLYKNGRIFLVDAFHGNAELADSVNHLLVVGFYLVNVGYVTLALKTSAVLLDVRSSIELLSQKIGYVLLLLGVMHFFNIFVFHRMRRRKYSAREARASDLS